jgi:hypothetical protein
MVSCSENKVLLVFNRYKVKNYVPNKPFVFANKVIVSGNVKKDELKRLTLELNNYWDDSLKVKKVTQFGFFEKIKNPPIFDTANISNSAKFMNAYLNSQGYYYATIEEMGPAKIDTIKDQMRTTVTMKVDVGKNITIDSVSYKLVDTFHQTRKDTVLQLLAMKNYPTTFLKKGTPYNKQVVSDELDKLVSFFRQNGFYKFTREHIYALVDSTNESLFKLTLDPISLAKLIAKAEAERKKNPIWEITIKQRDGADSVRLDQFYIGKIYYYPETKSTDSPDSLIIAKWLRELPNKTGNLVIRDYIGNFRLRTLREHTFLQKDSIYNEELFYKTVNKLAKIPSWKQTDARIIERTKDTLDFHFFLVPQKKFQTDYRLDASRNTGDFTSGNLLGLSLNSSLNNFNVWKRAIQSNTNLSGGIELNFSKPYDTLSSKGNLIQSMQFSLSHSYIFPRLLLPIKSLNNIFNNVENKRTIITGSLAYTERFETFKIRNFNLNFGYEWKKKNNLILWKPLNIESYNIDTLPGLDTIFKNNPYLRNSFNTGNVVGFGIGSINLTRTYTGKHNPRNSHFVRLGMDESGLATSLFTKLDEKVYKYVKFEAEYRFVQKLPKSEIAYRLFSGIGIPLGGKSLPFFKQYSAGGPYSMRAWGLRQLGLGSSILSDTIPATSFRDRFGDMQLEANFEYRFNIATFGPLKLASTIFTDIGNVWNVKKDDSDPEAEFSLDHFTKDIAIAVGTGLRFDFSYFLVRVDFAYKAKDPGRITNNGWMSIKDFTWKEERNNQGRTEIKNYAFQLGIGLPF